MSNRPLEHIPLVKSVMTPFPYHLETSDTISRAREMMAEHDIRHLPVVQQGELVGVISEHDVRQVLESTPGDHSRVGDVRLAEAFVVGLSEPLDRVLRAMAERHLGAALVVKGDKLAGIFTATDACRSFADFLLAIYPPKGSGDAA